MCIFFKEKAQTLGSLQQFFAEIQADRHTIRRIRTDCGKEFCNAQVNKFLLSGNVKHEVTTPRAPEQNGYIE